MQKRYPKQLSYGANNPVIALSDKEAAKIFQAIQEATLAVRPKK